MSTEDRYVFGKIRFGEYHEKLLGRAMWVWWRTLVGFAMGTGAAVITYGLFRDLSTAAFAMAFLALFLEGMDGSRHARRQKMYRVANRVINQQESE